MKIVLDTDVLISGVLNPSWAPGSILNAVLADPGDVPFYDVAISGAADYLVTGNIRHFPSEPFVVSPRDLLDILRGG